MLAQLDHLNSNTGTYAIVLGMLVLVMLGWLIALQQQQLQTLQDWEAERRATEHQRLALEQARMAVEEAQLVDRLEREQQVHKSREDVAEASALLHQLKRQFG